MAAPEIRAPQAVLLAILLLVTVLMPAAAWADAPPRAGDPAKAPPGATQAQAAPPASKDTPLNPRWKVRSWTISGLTVWTFRPGHFVRN